MNKIYNYLFKVKNGGTIPVVYIILFGVAVVATVALAAFLITTLLYFKN